MKLLFTSLSLFLFLTSSLIPQRMYKSPDGTTEGFRRYPLFEEVTNASCGPCASANPSLNSFLDAMHDSLVAVTYHAWWPGINDPMYQHNVAQNRFRIQFMAGNVNATPWLNVDGIIVDVWPFSAGNLQGAYNQRMAIPSPVGLAVSHVKISDDSIEVRVQATNLSELPAGTWKLKVFAVEHPINYTSPPGSNGERFFPHVFRKAVPSNEGEAYPTAAGVYSFTYRYKIEPAWEEKSVYSVALVQNDVSKEVLNSYSSKFGGVVPVELAAFAATQQQNGILVDWVTATETNNYGFEIQKSTDGTTFATEAFIPGNGTKLSETKYSYFIKELAPGDVWVRLKQIDFDGTATFAAVEKIEYSFAPDSPEIYANYPNPFNPSTVIRYGLSETMDISLEVFNVMGEKVKTLEKGLKAVGQHEVVFDATGLNSGVYFVQLQTPKGNFVRKISLMK